MKIEKLYNGESAGKLYDMGYRQISRKYKTVARVDVSFLEMLKRCGEEEALKGKRLSIQRIECIKDYYRRCLSEDRIKNLPDNVIKKINQMHLSEI